MHCHLVDSLATQPSENWTSNLIILLLLVILLPSDLCALSKTISDSPGYFTGASYSGQPSLFAVTDCQLALDKQDIVTLTHLLENLIFFSASPNFPLPPSTLLSLSEPSVPLCQHGESMDSPLLLKPDQLLGQEIEHLPKTLALKLGQRFINKWLLQMNNHRKIRKSLTL